MRIAIGFFGHLRTFENTAPSLRNFFHGNDEIDIFMHCWSTYDANSPSWWRQQLGDDSRTPVDKEKIIATYKLKKLLVEEQNLSNHSLENTFGSSQIPFDAVMFMLQSMRQCINLIYNFEFEEDFKYDLVFMLRPDVYLNQKINFEKIYNSLIHERYTTIHFPLNLRPVFDDIDIITKYGAMDVFFCSKSFVLKDIFNDLVEVKKSFNNFLIRHPSISSPEVAFHNYLKEKEINTEFKKINYTIYRKNTQSNLYSQFYVNRSRRSVSTYIKKNIWRRLFLGISKKR